VNGLRWLGEAERLAAQSHHYTYGDGADPVIGAALAAEGQIYATLAVAASTRDEILREAARRIREIVSDLYDPGAEVCPLDACRAADLIDPDKL